MITINNKEYRNIVEQVQKNKEDIAAHYAIDRVLADFGIKIIGQLTPTAFAAIKENETPPPTGALDYGASYAVGTSDPYTFWIWTRADVQSGGNHATDYWLDIGKLAIEGIKGNDGVSVVAAKIDSNYNIVLTMSDGSEITVPGNIRGPQGIQGNLGKPNPIAAFQINPANYRPTLIFEDGSQATANISIRGEKGEPGIGQKGDPGIPGASLYIRAIVAGVNQMERPITDYYGAYLVGSSAPYNLYVPLKDTGDYQNIGQYTGGSIISKNGVFQLNWNADTKLDKNTETGSRRLYGISANGQPTYPSLDYRNNGGTYQILVRRDATGNITIPNQPTQDTDAASKYYVDNKTKLYHHSIEWHADNWTIYIEMIDKRQQYYDIQDLTTLPIGAKYQIVAINNSNINYWIPKPVLIQFDGPDQIVLFYEDGTTVYIDPRQESGYFYDNANVI